jgi:hypothetical protein
MIGSNMCLKRGYGEVRLLETPIATMERKGREAMIPRLLFAVVWLSLATTAGAQPVQLITDKEAQLPAAPQAPSRAITRGPGLKLLSPDSVVNGAFPLKVIFEPRGGSKIDPASVQVIYLKNPPVDLTSRIKSAIRPDGIDLASATAPGGEHPIRISVRDDEGRQGSLVINLSVK